jgi:hypothetical protein
VGWRGWGNLNSWSANADLIPIYWNKFQNVGTDLESWNRRGCKQKSGEFFLTLLQNRKNYRTLSTSRSKHFGINSNLKNQIGTVDNF